MHQLRIPLQLRQSDAGHDVGHVAFVVRSDDIVLPCAELGLGESILALTVQGQQLQLLVDGLTVESVVRTPGKSTSLGSSQILHGMEGE